MYVITVSIKNSWHFFFLILLNFIYFDVIQLWNYQFIKLKLKLFDFFIWDSTNILQIAQFIVFVTIESRMADDMGQPQSNENSSTATVNSTNVEEQTEEDFAAWITEKEPRYIIKNCIVDEKLQVKVSMISDTIAWSICNLLQPKQWQIPTDIITSNAKVKSVIWINSFKKYVKAYMKIKWQQEYVRIFQLPKYSCLRTDGNTAILSYKSIVEMTKMMRSKDVRIAVCLYWFFISLNLNFHLWFFILNPSVGSLNLQSWNIIGLNLLRIS